MLNTHLRYTYEMFRNVTQIYFTDLQLVVRVTKYKAHVCLDI